LALKPRPVEWLIAGYCLTVIAVCAVRADRPGIGWIALAHALLIGLLLWLVRRPGLGQTGTVLRDAAPLVLLLGLYGSIDLINGSGAVSTHDPTVRRWDQWLFGTQPALAWWQGWPSKPASAVFHAAYFSYYLIVPFPVAWFFASGRPDAARRSTFAILTSFLICYLGFLFFPVAGPYYEFPRPPAWFLDNGPARWVYAVLAGGSSYGAAFPSSHVAATWAAVLTTVPAGRTIALALAVPAGLLTAGVVYCQMHYASDVIAGLGVALVATALGSYFKS
jgi:membrane-associated phospholipid phosphatase